MFWNTWQLWNPTCVQKKIQVQFAGWCCWNRNASVAPAKTYDCKSQTPKRLTTRMAGSWRDKHTQGQHVWMRRSRYVAREFAWLSPDRQDLLSPASSVQSSQYVMRWRLSNYVLCCAQMPFWWLNRKSWHKWHAKMLQVKQPSLYLEECSRDKDWISGLRCGMNPLALCWRWSLGLKSANHTGGCKCLLMLHVDDVLCPSIKDYLECVLLRALKAKYIGSLAKRSRIPETCSPSWREGPCCWVRMKWFCKAIQNTWNAC